MINARTGLAAAALAVGAGAVVFLSTNSPQPVGNVGGFGPVPVELAPPTGLPDTARPLRVVPAAVTPSTSNAAPAPAIPARQIAPPSSTSARRATPAPAPRRAQTPANSQRTPSSAQSGSSAPTQQQPQPAGTEPNGTGGWQLPACYQESCVAPASTQAAPQERASDSGLLGDALDTLTAPVLGLIGGL